MCRTQAKIDWDLVDEMLIAGSPGTEIAEHFSIHPNTFYDRVKEKYNISFTEYSQSKNSTGNSLIRLQQFKKAIGVSKKGDNQLLLMLGRERLGQDKQKEEKEKDINITIIEKPWSNDKDSNPT